MSKKTVQKSIRIPEHIDEWVEGLAKEEHRTFSAQVVKILSDVKKGVK